MKKNAKAYHCNLDLLLMWLLIAKIAYALHDSHEWPTNEIFVHLNILLKFLDSKTQATTDHALIGYARQ